MKKNNRFCIFLFISCILLFSSCRTVNFGSFSGNYIDINGMVYDFSSRPIPHCDISLNGRYITSSDINGRFTLPRLRPGEYELKAEKRGFESYLSNIDIQERGQIIYFRMPSQIQLLNLADDALTANETDIAMSYIARAHGIDSNNIETLFYYAVIKFLQNKNEEAIDFLEKAKLLGSNDYYVDKFLTQLKEIQYAN